MKIYILKLKVLVAVILLVSSGAHGSDEVQNSFVCGQKEDLRLISVEYLDPPKAVPCRVVYTKTQEGTVKYPWNAKIKAGTVRNKQYLAKKLSGLGSPAEKGKAELRQIIPITMTIM